MKNLIIVILIILHLTKLYSQAEIFTDYFINDNFLKSDIVFDLNYMIKSIEDVHPNPYHSNSKDYIYSLKDSIISCLSDTISKHHAYLIFKRITASYGEGHTDVLLFITAKDLHKYQESLPLWVNSYNNEGFIVNSNAIDTIEIRQGDIITAINGVSHLSMKNEIAKYSGESETFALNDAVGILFPLWIELLDIHAPFILTYKRNENYMTIKTYGISALKYNELYSHMFTNRNEPFTFSILENNIAYIEFTTFDYPKKFRKFLYKSFKTIKKKKCAGLIIDIRENGGGKEDIGPILIDYIYDKPYTKIYATDQKVSTYHKNLKKEAAKRDEYKYLYIDTISAYFKAPEGTILKERDTTVIYPTNNELRYKGKVCVLIGPKCFSYANQFASEIKFNKIVDLIGEPLEERQDGYANVSHFLLPKTKFKFMTSTAYFFSIDKNNSEPVQPDILISRSLEDIEKGDDSILEYAKNWILKQ